jgi:SAM-dependent methyltransferase
VLARPDLGLPAHPRVLDAGCGTGENLRFLRELLDPAYLGGFDVSEEALALARIKAPGADLYTGDVCDPGVRTETLDLVVSCDVIYVPGAKRAMPGLRRLVAHLRPGGLLVLNLPAYRWLYSRHDVAVHSSERYTAGEVQGLLRALGLEVEILSYRLCLLFPLVLASRLPGKLRARPGDPTARSDLHRVPSEAVSRALLAVLRLENALIARGVRLPFGSSIFAVGRKSTRPDGAGAGRVDAKPPAGRRRDDYLATSTHTGLDHARPPSTCSTRA